MQGTPGERVQALGHGHARAKDEEGVTAKPVRGRLPRQLAERGGDAMLARLSGVQDQRRGRLR